MLPLRGIIPKMPLQNTLSKTLEPLAGSTGQKTGTPQKRPKRVLKPFAGWLKRGEDAVVPVSRYMGRRMGGSGLLATN
jgi:hypothetical protein